MARRTVLTSRQRSALFSLPQREADLLRHLHPERRRPAEHRGPAASPQQAGLRAAAVRAPLPGPPAGSGRVCSAGRRGFHRTPARPGWGRARRLRGAVRDPARASLPNCAACTDSGPSRAGRHASSATGSAKKRNGRSRTRIWCAGSSRPVIAREPSCRPRRRSSGSAPTRWSTRNARSKPASPSGSRPGFGATLEHLLEETVDAGVTRFVWLRQFEPGSNSADANRLLDRREHLRRLDVPEGLFHDVPAHRITRLRRQGERYFADGLRELPDNRRLAILAVCAFEWEMFLADARGWRPTTGSSAERIAKPHAPAMRSSGTKRPRSARRSGRSPNWGRR